MLNIEQGPPKLNHIDTPPSTSHNPTTTTPSQPHVRHTDNKLNHIHLTESEFSGDSSGGYNYPEYTLPLIQPYNETHDEYHQQNGAYHDLFYSENYTDQNELLPNYVSYPPTNQRPFSASSSSCSSLESSEVQNQQQYSNYPNLISFYGHNSQPVQNGRPVLADGANFANNFKMAPSPAVQEGGYTSVIVDNTQQFHHHGGGVNEYVH